MLAVHSLRSDQVADLNQRSRRRGAPGGQSRGAIDRQKTESHARCSRVPGVAHDLVRAREPSRQDLMRARHRLSKLLLRHEVVYSAGRAWNQMHDRWLRLQRLDSAAT